MEVLLAGAFGGFANEALHWYGLRSNSNFPEYAKSFVYWAVTLVMIGVGAGFAYIQLGPGASNLFLAFELGLLAPLLLKKTLASGKPMSGAMNANASEETSVFNFIKG